MKRRKRKPNLFHDLIIHVFCFVFVLAHELPISNTEASLDINPLAVKQNDKENKPEQGFFFLLKSLNFNNIFISYIVDVRNNIRVVWVVKGLSIDF